MTSKRHNPNLAELNLQPKLNHELETVWAWLEDKAIKSTKAVTPGDLF